MSAYFKSNGSTSPTSKFDASIANTQALLRDDSSNEPPILSSYDRTELVAREALLQQIAQQKQSEIAALERKVFSDALRDQFELTGLDLPADANSRQLHLF